MVAADRGLRVEAELAPGWWRFSVEGRQATPVGPAEAPEEVLALLPSAAGHWSGTRLVHGSADAEPMHLRPEDEMPRFAACRGRRWYSGDLVFERLELEGEGEEAARRAYEDHTSLSGVKGIPATLRAAFALAVVAEVSARTGIRAAPVEVRAEIGHVAEAGWPAAESILARLDTERREQAARVRARERLRRSDAPAAPVVGAEGDPAARAAAALAGSGATLLDSHRLSGGLLVVKYRFLGERFRAVVQEGSLQVVDAGICLAGHDRELTLASLPPVIREGVEAGDLVITDHV